MPNPQFSDTEMKEFLKEIKPLDELYQYYRDRSSIAVGTMIVFSSVVLGLIINEKENWLSTSICIKSFLIFFGMVPFFFTIVFGVCVQYLYFKGYKEYAQHKLCVFSTLPVFKEVFKLAESNSKENLINTSRDLFKNSNTLFKKAEKLTDYCFMAFLIGVIALLILIIIYFAVGPTKSLSG